MRKGAIGENSSQGAGQQVGKNSGARELGARGSLRPPCEYPDPIQRPDLGEVCAQDRPQCLLPCYLRTLQAQGLTATGMTVGLQHRARHEASRMEGSYREKILHLNQPWT